MPFMSDRDLGLMTGAITKRDSQIEAGKRKLETALATNKFLLLGEAGLAAASFGYLRGSYEDAATGAWNIPNTTFDIEAATVIAGTAASLLGVYYKPLIPYAQHAANATAGILGHYMGQVARKYAKTKKFSSIAGSPGIGALPQYDPVSYDPTQFSGVYDDPVASSLASSGI